MPLPAIDTIQARRVRMRAVAEADLPDLLDINGDAGVTHFLPYATWAGVDDATAWLVRMQALVATGTAHQLVIQRTHDAKVIGTVLLFKFDEASARLELGYVLGRAHWRQGFASEAVHAVCTHAFGQLGVRRIEAEVNPDNVASGALMSRLGFVREGLLRQRWVGKGRAYDTHIYGCLGGELREANATRLLATLDTTIARPRATRGRPRREPP